MYESLVCDVQDWFFFFQPISIIILLICGFSDCQCWDESVI